MYWLGKEHFLRLPLRLAGLAGHEIHQSNQLALCADAPHHAWFGVRVSLDPVSMANVLDLIRIQFHSRPFSQCLSGRMRY